MVAMMTKVKGAARALGTKKMTKSGRALRRCFAASPVRRTRRTERLPDGGIEVEGRADMSLTPDDGESMDCRGSGEGNASTTSSTR